MNTVQITHTGFCVVEQQNYAYHGETGQVAITNNQKIEIDCRLRDGNTVMLTIDENSLPVSVEYVKVQTQPTKEEAQMPTTKLGSDFAKDELKSLNTRILKIAKAENVVHTELGAFSREVLAYVLRTKDITPINRIIGADKDGKTYLTRNNRVVAMHFFAEFVPFSTEGKASEGTLTFGKLKGERSQEKTAKLINDFLHNPEATIWTWAKDNIKTEKKPVDYAAKVGNAITNALDADKGNMSKADVLMAVLRSGISLDDMLAVADLLTQGEEKAA